MPEPLLASACGRNRPSPASFQPVALPQVRPLADRDFPGLLRIQAACYHQIVPESEASLRAKLRAAPATCMAACLEGELVAYLIAVPVVYPQLPPLDAPTFEAPPVPDTLYLHDLAVAPAGRGTGAGQALVEAVLAQARAAGLQQACLVAIQDSASYWGRQGFQAVDPPDAASAAKVASYGTGAQLMIAWV